MQTSGRVDNHNVDIVGFGRLERVECHCGGVAAEFLLYDRHACPFAPYVELFHGCGTECVGGAEHHFVSGSLELCREFAYRCGLPDAVYPDNHYYMGFVPGGYGEILLGRFVIVLGKQFAYFFAKEFVKLR